MSTYTKRCFCIRSIFGFKEVSIYEYIDDIDSENQRKMNGWFGVFDHFNQQMKYFSPDKFHYHFLIYGQS